MAHLLQAKHRELLLQLEMLECPRHRRVPRAEHRAVRRGGPRAACTRPRTSSTSVPPTAPDAGPWLDADAFVAARPGRARPLPAFAPDLESHVEVRDGQHRGDGVQRRRARRADRPGPGGAGRGAAAPRGRHARRHLRQRRAPTAARPRRSGLAGHEETQEGLAVLAEYLVGGLTASRLRQLAARVVAVHADARRAPVPRGARRTRRRRRLRRPGVHDHDAGVPLGRAHEGRRVPARACASWSTTSAPAASLDTLWLGKMPLAAVPLVDDLHERGVLARPAAAAALPRRPGGARPLAAHPPKSTRWPRSIGDAT